MPTKKGYNNRSLTSDNKTEMKSDKAKTAAPKKAKPKKPKK
jgi:hypothetical protein